MSSYLPIIFLRRVVQLTWPWKLKKKSYLEVHQVPGGHQRNYSSGVCSSMAVRFFTSRVRIRFVRRSSNTWDFWFCTYSPGVPLVIRLMRSRSRFFSSTLKFYPVKEKRPAKSASLCGLIGEPFKFLLTLNPWPCLLSQASLP